MTDASASPRSSDQVGECLPAVVTLPGAARLARLLLRLSAAFHRLPTVLATGVIIGVLPPALSILAGAGGSYSGLVTACLIVPVLCSLVLRGRASACIFFLAAVFVSHCAFCICVSGALPAAADSSFQGGSRYLDHSLEWIRTGTKPEFEYQSWLGSQLLQVVGVAVLGFASFGLVPLNEGVYECDIMNFYVGQVTWSSSSPLQTLALAWHPWSICRGIGLLLLLNEAVTLACMVFVARPTQRQGGLRMRLALAALFLALDIALKGIAMEAVQRQLHSALKGSPLLSP